MKKNRVKNVFLSIFLILFIVGSLLLIIKSIDYSKKISNRKDVNSVKDKKEILIRIMIKLMKKKNLIMRIQK